MKVRKAVIPAAGFGTRFLPITKAVPKELLPIVDRPAIAYVVDEAIEAGIEEILIIISPHKEQIRDYFVRNRQLEQFLIEKNNHEALKLIEPIAGVSIAFAIQHEQLGFGHAVLQAKEFVGNEPFAVLTGDDLFYSADKPVIAQLIDVYSQNDGHILGTMKVPRDQVNRYGICVPKPNQAGPVFELVDIVEKPEIENAPSQSASAGRYILRPEIFKYLESQQRGVGNEIQLTDAIKRSMQEVRLFSYDFAGIRYDVGSKEGYLKAVIEYALRRDDLKVSTLIEEIWEGRREQC